MEDIPEAKRELSPSTRLKAPMRWKYLLWGLIGFAIALLSGAIVAWRTAPALDLPAVAESPTAQSTESPASPASPSPTASLPPPTLTPAVEDPMEDSLLGHLPYEEAPPDQLRPIVDDGSILLRQTAAEKFMDLVADAEQDGVIIVPVSGFRSIADQEEVFFEVKAERGQVATQRAEVSAPPGYSEHHTGYAVDIMDGTRPDIELVQDFEQTPAFRWMQQNAAFYSFEMSFPPHNPQGINYEPWHWRFVGDRDSLETFYRATRLRDASPSEALPNATPPASTAQP